MRSSPSLSSLALAALGLVTGCNLVFGLDEVSEKDPGGASGAGGTGGTGGAAPLCPDPEIPGSLVSNGSFEDGIWDQPLGMNAKHDRVPAEDCDLACGEWVGRLTGSCAPGEQSTLLLSREILWNVELGSTLRLGARYRFEAKSTPYFTLTVNGYPIGNQFIKGAPQGDHFLLQDQPILVDDPRRTGDHAQLHFNQNIGDGETMRGDEATDLLDCVSLTYEPPPGAQLLTNGWFESSTQTWQADGGATLELDGSHGKCGIAGGHLTVPMNVNGEVLRTTVTGSWSQDTTFSFGGAVGPPTFDVAPIIPCSIFLRLEYTDDMNPGTPDVEEAVTLATTASEPWKKATGTLTATRPVIAVTVGLVADSSASGSPAELMADCFSVRALP